MSLLLVNTNPGQVSRTVTPTDTFKAGLRSSDSGLITLGKTRLLSGFTRIANMGVLPENDTGLAICNAVETLATTEHRLPVTGTIPRIVSGPGIALQKFDNSDNDNCVYELSVELIDLNSPVLGYFKFYTNTSWAIFNPDWCSLSNMTGMYFGLEHQAYNTAAYAFLRQHSSGHGSLVTGGPLQEYTQARPGQDEITAFDWLALPNNSVVEVWVYFNTVGRPPPFTPSYTPVVEIWTQRDGVDTEPVLQLTVPVDSFGSFLPLTSSFSNARLGPSNKAILYFGNAGRTGDVLQLDDWAIYPEFRLGVSEGQALVNNTFSKLPDLPTQFRASNGLLLSAGNPDVWVPGQDSIAPVEAMVFQPGQVNRPQYEKITKSSTTIMNLQREEPQLTRKAVGMMVEAFMAGAPLKTDLAGFGAGLSIEDGTYVYQVVMLQDATDITYGITNNTGITDSFDGWFLPMSGSAINDIDYTTLKMVRLWVDRRRGRVLLFVDEDQVLVVNSLTTFPAAAFGGRVVAGHLLPLASTGDFQVDFLNYLHSYDSFEDTDGNPTSVGFTLESVGVNTVTPGTPLQIVKQAFNTANTECYFQTSALEPELDGGWQIDFQASVVSYQDIAGLTFGPQTWTGSGVKVWLGNQSLTLGFFDCGTFGRMIGVVPGSGSIADITSQTALGRQFSAPYDWTAGGVAQNIRITYRAYDRIEVYIGAINNTPAFVIPWSQGLAQFDLPLETKAAAFGFGHFDENTASTTNWSYFRYGVSNGYDVSLSQQSATGYPPYLFGGRFLFQSEFDE